VTDLKQYRITASNAAGLVQDIEGAVARGELTAGEALPSVRRLALEVGLSPVTVTAALAELRRRGVVVSEQRRGTRIAERPPIGSARAAVPVPPGARDLSLGNPDPALLPNLELALARIGLPVRLYGEPAAVPELAALAHEQLRADGIAGEPPCIVSGALDAIERVIEAHLRPGDRVAVENPGYAALFDLLRARGLVLEAVTVDDRGMLADELQAALERGASAAIITPRGQNPTGAALDAARAKQLRAVLASAPRALVIEDDHLGPVAGSSLHTTVTGRERWAATRSVAKSLGPDLRLAVLAGDRETLARVQGRQECGPGWVSHILQRLVLSLWQDADVLALIERASATYSARRERFLHALQAHGVHARGASGLNVWIGVEEEAGALGALLARGWALAPGAPFRLAGSSPAIRATISTLSEREAGHLAADVADVLAPARARRSG
jgi:DNA-binding transcriptional MocR family regulator